MYILISPLLKYAFIILWVYGKVVIMVISCMLDNTIEPHHLHFSLLVCTSGFPI